MDQHEHPDLLDAEIDRERGSGIGNRSKDPLGWCRECNARHMYLCEAGSLFFSECAVCGYLLP